MMNHDEQLDVIIANAQFAKQNRPFVSLFRRFARIQLRIRGYSKEQATGMINKLGDGKILEFIKKYGPVIWKIFMALLPFLLALEPAPPANQPIDAIADEFTELEELNKDVPLMSMYSALMENVPD